MSDVELTFCKIITQSFLLYGDHPLNRIASFLVGFDDRQAEKFGAAKLSSPRLKDAFDSGHQNTPTSNGQNKTFFPDFNP